LVMLPFGPVGAMAEASRLLSVTMRWTDGDSWAEPELAEAAGAGGRQRGGAAAGAAARGGAGGDRADLSGRG
jgi:hypothetical protein